MVGERLVLKDSNGSTSFPETNRGLITCLNLIDSLSEKKPEWQPDPLHNTDKIDRELHDYICGLSEKTSEKIRSKPKKMIDVINFDDDYYHNESPCRKIRCFAREQGCLGGLSSYKLYKLGEEYKTIYQCKKSLKKGNLFYALSAQYQSGFKPRGLFVSFFDLSFKNSGNGFFVYPKMNVFNYVGMSHDLEEWIKNQSAELVEVRGNSEYPAWRRNFYTGR